MTPAQTEFLKQKMVKLQLHLNKQEADKRASNAGFSEEIKAVKHRMQMYAETIASQCEDLAGSVMDETEWNDFKGMK